MSVAAQAPTVPGGVRTLVEPLCRTQQQLEGTAGFLRWLCMTEEARATDTGDVRVLRSVPQLIRGMELPNGPNIRATQQRWRNQVYRWVEYLEPLGVTAREAPKGRDGRGRGVIFTVPAGVAQSVKAAVRTVSRVPPRLRIPFWWNQVSAPPTGATSVAGSSNPRSLRVMARAHVNPVVAPENSRPAASVAAPTAPRSTAAVRGAVAAWREHTDAPWRLSPVDQERIERYSALIDQRHGDGAGQRWLVDAIHDTFDGCGTAPVFGAVPWDWTGPRGGGPPKSLAYFARLLRRRYRQLRRYR